MPVPGFEPFSCELQVDGVAARVVPSGELDLLTTPELQQQLTGLHAAGHKKIVLDLHGVPFLDSSALHLIVSWTDASNADGFRFAITPGSPRHQRLFELVGIAPLLHVEP